MPQNMPETLLPYAAIVAEAVTYTVFPFPGFDKARMWCWDGYTAGEGLDYQWPDGQTVVYRRKNWQNWSSLDCPLILKNIRPQGDATMDWSDPTIVSSNDERRYLTTVEVPAGTKFTRTFKTYTAHTENVQNKIVAGLEASFEEHLGSQYKTNFSATLKQTVSFSYERQWGDSTTESEEVDNTIEYGPYKRDRTYEINAVRAAQTLRSTVSVPPTFEFEIHVFHPDINLPGDGRLIAREGVWGSRAELLSVFNGQAPDSVFWGATGRSQAQMPVSRGGQHMLVAAHKLQDWAPTEPVTYTAELNSVTAEHIDNRRSDGKGGN